MPDELETRSGCIPGAPDGGEQPSEAGNTSHSLPAARVATCWNILAPKVERLGFLANLVVNLVAARSKLGLKVRSNK